MNMSGETGIRTLYRNVAKAGLGVQKRQHGHLLYDLTINGAVTGNTPVPNSLSLEEAELEA